MDNKRSFLANLIPHMPSFTPFDIVNNEFNSKSLNMVANGKVIFCENGTCINDNRTDELIITTSTDWSRWDKQISLTQLNKPAISFNTSSGGVGGIVDPPTVLKQDRKGELFV